MVSKTIQELMKAKELAEIAARNAHKDLQNIQREIQKNGHFVNPNAPAKVKTYTPWFQQDELATAATLMLDAYGEDTIILTSHEALELFCISKCVPNPKKAATLINQFEMAGSSVTFWKTVRHHKVIEDLKGYDKHDYQIVVDGMTNDRNRVIHKLGSISKAINSHQKTKRIESLEQRVDALEKSQAAMKVKMKTTGVQQQIIDIYLANPTMKQKDIAAQVNVNISSVSRALKKLHQGA